MKIKNCVVKSEAEIWRRNVVKNILWRDDFVDGRKMWKFSKISVKKNSFDEKRSVELKVFRGVFDNGKNRNFSFRFVEEKTSENLPVESKRKNEKKFLFCLKKWNFTFSHLVLLATVRFLSLWIEQFEEQTKEKKVFSSFFRQIKIRRVDELNVVENFFSSSTTFRRESNWREEQKNLHRFENGILNSSTGDEQVSQEKKRQNQN